VSDLPSRIRSPDAYHRWLVETSQDAIRQARALLEQTKPLVRAPVRLIRPPDAPPGTPPCTPRAMPGVRARPGVSDPPSPSRATGR
jgi:hypothetical protein